MAEREDARPVPGGAMTARLAGLEVAALRRMQCPDFTAGLRRHLAAEARKLEQGRALAEQLYDVIGGLGTGRIRHALVSLRRDLHHGDAPAARVLAPEVLDPVPTQLAAEITEWAARRRDLRLEVEELEALLAEESARGVEALRGGSGHPAFLQALALAGPTLVEELAKWRADPRGSPAAARP